MYVTETIIKCSNNLPIMGSKMKSYHVGRTIVTGVMIIVDTSFPSTMQLVTFVRQVEY